MARKVVPELAFERAQGAYMWDADNIRYIDLHGAFGPCILGHNNPRINDAVVRAMVGQFSLCGSGTNSLEGRFAELMCTNIPSCEMVQVLNTGTEATMAALRMARGITGRDHIIVIQGGFNGSHNDVACNVLTPLSQIGPRVSPGEYKCVPLGTGVPQAHQQLIHIVNFNDLDSVRYVCERYSIAALITEPILQNLGVIKPQPGYLQGLRQLADQYGFVLVFDEVKTGFRYSVSGYSEISCVQPDLVVWAKAIANGYPISALGGKRDLMEQLCHADPAKRPFMAGTYNGHPVALAAAIATIECLLENQGDVYRHLEMLGSTLEAGISDALTSNGITHVVSRQGSALCIYFMDHHPQDWHDLASHHRVDFDARLRQALVQRGVYVFPLAMKQWSISAAHTKQDIEFVMDAFDQSITQLKSSYE